MSCKCCECCCDIFGYICNAICCEIFGCNFQVQNQDVTNTEKSEKSINPNCIDDPTPSNSVQDFPFFIIENGSVFNLQNNSYSINDNGQLKCKFSIIGKKKIYFMYAQKAGQFECGVIIQSEFKLNNNTKYNYMLANMGCVRNESCKNESCIILSFFKDLNSCKSQLLNGQIADSYLMTGEIIKPENYTFPFNLILCTTGKQVEIVPENTEEYRNSQNGLKFIDTFARKCDDIQIPKGFKVKLIEALNEELGIKKEIKANNIENHWREYAETASLPRSPNLERRPIKINKTRHHSF
jgi:hypothetical protein